MNVYSYIRKCKLTVAMTALAASVLYPGFAFSADQATIDAANKEGRVVWYTSFLTNTIARPMAQAFEQKYPDITVELANSTTGDIYTKLVAESQAGKIVADVADGFSTIPELRKGDIIDPYLSGSLEGYPSELFDPEGYWTYQVVYFQPGAINTELVSAEDAPRTWDDLLDPKWKGKIAWAGGMTGGAPAYIGVILRELGEEKGMEFLKKLAEQEIVNVPSNQRVVLDHIITGEYHIGLGMYNHHINNSKGQGAPVEELRIQPYMGSGNATFLVNNRPHPNAGKLLLDFILSDEGQKVFSEAGYIPANPNVAPIFSHLTPDGGGFRPSYISPTDIEKNMEKWSSIYLELFVNN